MEPKPITPLVNQKIEEFSFFQPVVLKEKLSTSKVSNFFWKIGAWADQFAYLGGKELNVSPEHLYAHHFSFEKNRESDIPFRRTLVKVFLYCATFFALPIVAMAIKAMYKWQLNSIAMLKENVKNTPFAEKRIGNTDVVLFKGDIFRENTNAIVNAANPGLWAGGGICGAFNRMAGKPIFDECEQILKSQNIKQIQTGEAVLTTIGELATNVPGTKVKAIVHAAGPDCSGLNLKDPDVMNEASDKLAQTYTSSLEVITDPACHQLMVSDKVDRTPLRSISFCSISTGIFSFPVEKAAEVALEAIKTFIEKNPKALDEVRFVIMANEPTTQKAYQEALDKI